MRIYIASSWRNMIQPALVIALRRCGHEVYDFRNPEPGSDGFRWSEIDPNWQEWSPEQFRQCLRDPIAQVGFGRDRRALEWADTCILLLPCGPSAHLEAGWCIGQGKRTYVLSFEKYEPELMYLMTDGILCSVDELFDELGEDSLATREFLNCRIARLAEARAT